MDNPIFIIAIIALALFLFWLIFYREDRITVVDDDCSEFDIDESLREEKRRGE